MERFITTKTDVNFRKGAGTGYAIIRTLSIHTPVQILDTVDNTTWYHARLTDGTVGYIRGLTQYVEPFVPGWLSTAQNIVKYGEGYMGTGYVFGSSRNTDKDFDCSDFTKWIFKKYGYVLGADSRAQSVQGVAVSLDELRTGDLIFYRNSKGVVHHVSMYVANDRLLHTYRVGVGVTYSDFKKGSYWRNIATTARRIIQ